MQSGWLPPLGRQAARRKAAACQEGIRGSRGRTTTVENTKSSSWMPQSLRDDMSPSTAAPTPMTCDHPPRRYPLASTSKPQRPARGGDAGM